MRESEIERYLKKQVETNGGKCWKWVSPGRRGVPDRIVIMPGGVVAFVELKSPGKKERADQVRVQQILLKLGCFVFPSVDSKEYVDHLVLSLFLESTRVQQENQFIQNNLAKGGDVK